MGLRGYKEPSFSLKAVATVFPETLANVLRLFNNRETILRSASVTFDWSAMKRFQMELGSAIYNENFDKLDDVVLKFYKTYHCVKPQGTYIGRYYIFFPEESIEKFVNICNGFKNKTWNEVIDPFLDALHELFDSSSIKEKQNVPQP